MTGFLLDTNIPSEMLRPRPDANVSAWVKTQAKEALFVSVVTLGELRRGVSLLTEQSPRRAERWGVLDGQQQLAGRRMNIADGMIAATAVEYGLTVVTRNVKDFAGLSVELFNPWDPS